MEFGKQIKGKPLQVRIGWFYRPKDVMARRNHDPRLLVATMHSDMNSISSIRGRCVVTQQSYIKDLDAYKKKPDHFYYNQLFDRYIHRFYDVLPVESVRNLPADVAEELSRRYQYIVVEAGTASEYTDAHRCALCTKLAMESSSSPPLPSSPSPKQSSSVANNSTTSSGQNSPTPRGSPKHKSAATLAIAPTNNSNGTTSQDDNKAGSTKLTAPTTPQDQKMSHMWPFRYFGTHADIQDIFDPDDRVYPRASSRVGARYQAVVVKWDGPGQILVTSTIFDDPQNSVLKNRSRKGGRGGRPSQKQRLLDAETSESSSRAQSTSLDTPASGADTPVAPTSPSRSGPADENAYVERGGDETVSLLYSKPSNISEEFVADYMNRVKKLSLPLPIHSADLIDKALLTLQQNDFDAERALKEIAKVEKQDFDIIDWTPKEIEAFEEGIRIYGHELFAIKKKVETRSMKDIVRFFYQWKKTERYQPVYSVFTKINKPNKKFKAVGRGSFLTPALDVGNRVKGGIDPEQEKVLDHDSIILPTAENSGKFECTHCGATTTTVWRRAPGEVDLQKKYPKVFCNECGTDWVRYVTLPPLVDSQKESKKVKGKDKDKDKDKDKEKEKEKEKDTAVKGLANGNSKSTQSALDSANGVKRKRTDTKGGSGKKVKEQDYNCVLCTKSLEDGPQALKKTTGNNWAHILCAVWIPETTFVDTETLSPIESIGKIRQERWKQSCSICKQKSGACVSCGEGCKKAFHVTCARDSGYQIAFEMQPTKNVKGGLMVPMIWCPNHDLSTRKVIQIRDQPDAMTDKNALQTYVHYYKQCDKSIPSAMRKSRLLMALNPSIGSSPFSSATYQSYHVRRPSQGGYGSRNTSSKSLIRSEPQEICKICSITASPMWWEDKEGQEKNETQQLHAENNINSNNTVGHSPLTPPPTQPLSNFSAVSVKLEDHDNNHYEHKSLVASSEQHDEHSSSLLCHACYWDTKPTAV
ncbi:putative PHD type zinc finger protein with BAH domain-containing protein [Entomortierella beljakovae]|nr:putative PHD type zinc finger protein with BAH domain-containing protein [Entomortierella beljakovae]